MMKLGRAGRSCRAQFHTELASSTYSLKSSIYMRILLYCYKNALQEVRDVHALAVARTVAPKIEPNNLDIQTNQSGNQMVDVNTAVFAEAMHEQQARDGRGGGGVYPHGDVVDVAVADRGSGLDLEVEEGTHTAVGEQRGTLADGGEKGVELRATGCDDIAGVEQGFRGQQGQIGAGRVTAQRGG